MRVTQSMLSNNMLRNLSASYNNMGKLQNQIVTGKKVNRPSDDPIVAMKGIGYRMQVDKVAQFQRNLGEVHNYLDSTDDSLSNVGEALHRTNELMVNVSTGTLTQKDREAILAEVKHLREQVQDLANSKSGNKYIFSGTNTGTPLYDGGYGNSTGFTKDVEIEVFDGVTMNVNTNALDMFRDIDAMFAEIVNAVEVTEESSELGRFIGETQANMDTVLMKRADVGARQNRAELTDNRLASQEGAAKKQMSENEDIDYEKAITEMITQESIHRAALSVGARIIQPSLVDFLR